jgi:hypothetical protein
MLLLGVQCGDNAKLVLMAFGRGVVMKRIAACLLMLCVWTTTYAKQIEKVDFPDELTLGNQKLILNGVGLRTKKRLGMNFKVYVAGLYLSAKSSDANAVIASPGSKVLELVFLRGIDRETLQEAWQEGFTKNCKSECENARDQFKAFNDTMVDVSENSRLKMTFEKDGVSVEIKGAEASKKAQVIGEPFKKALMAIFIGDQPPTIDLKAGLLGQ